MLNLFQHLPRTAVLKQPQQQSALQILKQVQDDKLIYNKEKPYFH